MSASAAPCVCCELAILPFVTGYWLHARRATRLHVRGCEICSSGRWIESSVPLHRRWARSLMSRKALGDEVVGGCPRDPGDEVVGGYPRNLVRKEWRPSRRSGAQSALEIEPHLRWVTKQEGLGPVESRPLAVSSHRGCTFMGYAALCTCGADLSALYARAHSIASDGAPLRRLEQAPGSRPVGTQRAPLANPAT